MSATAPAATSQAFLGGSGEPYTIELDGVAYRFGRLTRERMNAYSVRWIEHVRRQLTALYGNDEARYTAKLDALERDALEGVYDFLDETIVGKPTLVAETRVIDGVPTAGQKLVMSGGVLRSKAGTLLLIAVLCGASENDALRLLTEKRIEVNHVMRLVLSESMRGMSAGGDDWKPSGGEDAAGNVQAPPQ